MSRGDCDPAVAYRRQRSLHFAKSWLTKFRGANKTTTPNTALTRDEGRKYVRILTIYKPILIANLEPKSKRVPVRLRNKIEKASAAKQRKARKQAKKVRMPQRFKRAQLMKL